MNKLQHAMCNEIKHKPFDTFPKCTDEHYHFIVACKTQTKKRCVYILVPIIAATTAVAEKVIKGTTVRQELLEAAAVSVVSSVIPQTASLQPPVVWHAICREEKAEKGMQWCHFGG